MKSKHKLKDVCSYFLGNLRYNVPWLMRKHVREQINSRHNSVRPICKANGACEECGCDIPKLLYANKTCGGACYPNMLGKGIWERMKESPDVYIQDNLCNYFYLDNRFYKFNVGQARNKPGNS